MTVTMTSSAYLTFEYITKLSYKTPYRQSILQTQIQRFELDGVQVTDERGFFAESIRKDWSDLFENDEWISQANLSLSYPGIIRAWHRHARGQKDYLMVLQGAMKIVAYGLTTTTRALKHIKN
jgi:dTDP-4-dehydrorhamnose 3,5-epimerase-like enzyme